MPIFFFFFRDKSERNFTRQPYFMDTRKAYTVLEKGSYSNSFELSQLDSGFGEMSFPLR